MTTTPVSAPTDLETYCNELADDALAAGREMVSIPGKQRAEVLYTLAGLLNERVEQLVEANQRDLARAGEFGLSDAMVDRLRLSPQRVEKMAGSVRDIAGQNDPVGRVMEGYVRPNGLRIEKTRVPLGVVLFIYESRPNVTSDAAALCIKSGNALILRGGKEAIHSNTTIAGVIREALSRHELSPDIVQLVETTDREAVNRLLKMDGRIDLAIPRGGESLIRAVVEQARIPVIKHYAGNCHFYVDAAADDEMAQELVLNAKCQRTGVCNAAETLLVHEQAAHRGLLMQLCSALREQGVELRVDERVCAYCPDCDDRSCARCAGAKPAREEDWSAEYLDKVMAVGVVNSVDEAIGHINRYGSHHTDGIVTNRIAAADAFTTRVDSANVMVNCSTRFSDGGEYGLGAEIGISTDKLHARGPMGADDLTTYKWIVRGQGQARG